MTANSYQLSSSHASHSVQELGRTHFDSERFAANKICG